MAEAGTDPAVIQAFVETSSVPYNLRSDEIIYLHDHGISSSIITAIMQRGAKLREQLAMAQANTALQAAQSPPADAASSYTAVQPVAPFYAASRSYPAYPSYTYTEPSSYYSPHPSFGFYFAPPLFFGHSYGHSFGHFYGHSFGRGHRFSGHFGSGRSFGGRH